MKSIPSIKFAKYCQDILNVTEDKDLRADIEKIISSIAYSSPETLYLHKQRLIECINIYMKEKTKYTITNVDIKILAAFTQKSVEEIITTLE